MLSHEVIVSGAKVAEPVGLEGAHLVHGDLWIELALYVVEDLRVTLALRV